MFLMPYEIRDSKIPGAQKGLFLTAPVKKGAMLMAPDQIHRVYTREELLKYPVESIEYQSYLRWFENGYTICPEWTDECYVNHSFTPNGLWHLGFVFATADLPAGTELTVDYRYFIHEGEDVGFADSTTGKRIIGMPAQDALRESTLQLMSLLSK